ncbi:MAG TPA: protease [Bacteroidales bacterium]|jgi:protease I|nr:protease [Bacteroidales bacterium]
MKKILVLLEKMVEDSEFLYPYLRLREEGFDVISAAPELKEYQGKGGMVFKPDYSFNEIKGITFDAIVVPGGYAPDMWRRNEGIVRFIRKHDERGKIIASICHGPWLLISAGIVKGRKVTGFHAIKDDLINAGALYDGSDWVEDNNLLSATNPATMLPMIKRLVEKLKE